MQVAKTCFVETLLSIYGGSGYVLARSTLYRPSRMWMMTLLMSTGALRLDILHPKPKYCISNTYLSSISQLTQAHTTILSTKIELPPNATLPQPISKVLHLTSTSLHGVHNMLPGTIYSHSASQYVEESFMEARISAANIKSP